MSHAKYLNRWRMLKIQFRAELSWTPPFSIFAILPCAPPGTPLITSPNSLGCCVSSPHIPSKPPHTAYHPISVTRPTFFGTGIEHVFVSGYCKCKWDCPVAQEWPSRCLETAWGASVGNYQAVPIIHVESRINLLVKHVFAAFPSQPPRVWLTVLVSRAVRSPTPASEKG